MTALNTQTNSDPGSRCVELNPVRASLMQAPGDWPWSSYRAHVAVADKPRWLDTLGLHGYLLGCEPTGRADHRTAARRCEKLVAEGLDVAL